MILQVYAAGDVLSDCKKYADAATPARVAPHANIYECHRKKEQASMHRLELSTKNQSKAIIPSLEQYTLANGVTKLFGKAPREREMAKIMNDIHM